MGFANAGAGPGDGPAQSIPATWSPFAPTTEVSGPDEPQIGSAVHVGPRQHLLKNTWAVQTSGALKRVGVSLPPKTAHFFAGLDAPPPQKHPFEVWHGDSQKIDQTKNGARATIAVSLPPKVDHPNFWE